MAPSEPGVSRELGAKAVVYAALGGNLLIAATKFAAAAMTGSSAMLSEGLHSLVDTGNQLLILYGLHRAKRPPDERHPFGHGHEIYFWSFVVAMMIFALGAGMSIYEGIKHLRHPEPMTSPTVNYWVLGLSMLFEGGSWLVGAREFRRQTGGRGYFQAVHALKDPTVFMVLFEDTAALLGLVVALIGILMTSVTGRPLFDGGASIVIGLILGSTAAWLAYETKSLIIGESANPHLLLAIRAILGQHRGVLEVRDVLTLHMGPESIIAAVSLDFDDSTPTGEVEATVGEAAREIERAFPGTKLFIEARSIGPVPSAAGTRARPEEG